MIASSRSLLSLFRNRCFQDQQKKLLSVATDVRSASSSSEEATPAAEASPLVRTTHRCRVPTHSRAQTVPLTVADLHLRHEQLPLCYYFPQVLDADELKQSLERVLRHFGTAGGQVIDFQRIECTPNDTVSLTFGEMDMSLQEWLSKPRGHEHRSGRGQHPILLPLFDALFDDNGTKKENDHAPLLTVRVTYFKNHSGTALAVNGSHLLGDTASCVRFVECWGRAQCQLPFSKPCLNRARAATSGMMTKDHVELLGIHDTKNNAPSWWPDCFNDWVRDESTTESDETEPTTSLKTNKSDLIAHEYVPLVFSKSVLSAMKAHGMSTTDTFVSTNDMVTAAGWLLKRVLSGQPNWNLSVVMNLRGRCGVSAFGNDDDDDDRANSMPGLFGNGIANAVVELEPSIHGNDIFMEHVATAARSIRLAMSTSLGEIPNRLEHSSLGRPLAVTSASGGTFSTTSWRQLAPWRIRFSPTAHPVGFDGQPAHPLPIGRTFSSVLHSNSEADGGCTYELFLPTDQAEQARQLHARLCGLFLEWHVALKREQASFET